MRYGSEIYSNNMRILGIETSCDETAVCVLECTGNFNTDFSYTIVGNALFSQAALHAPYGGVFPNLAKREHQKNLVPLLVQALTEAHILIPVTPHQGVPLVNTKGTPWEDIERVLERESELLPQVTQFLQTHAKPDIDTIAVTFGPGLEPALWPGINFAKALSMSWQIPLVPINHMEGHIVASVVGENNKYQVSSIKKEFEIPALALLVSGGHTELQLVKNFDDYQMLGETRDDAAGEAFDKIARILDLPYPGGIEISKLASLARGKTKHTTLPRGMKDSGDYDFSFSGLKTAARKLIEQPQPLSDEMRADIARETEESIVDVLVSKTLRATEEHGAQCILVGGGVAANSYLRSRLTEESKVPVLFPAPGLSTDNAVMIALAGYFQATKNPPTGGLGIVAQGNARL